MDKENDVTKTHHRLTVDQLEAILPRTIQAPDGSATLQGSIPRVFTRPEDGKPNLVFCLDDGSFHVFKEVEAKQAAENCGLADAKQRHTREAWNELWSRRPNRFVLDSIEGIKLIHPDGREELISEMTFPDDDA